jgi:hypothetical protein
MIATPALAAAAPQTRAAALEAPEDAMAEKLTLESAAKDRQWVFPLLTLDVVRPFYDLMGLKQEADVGLQKALRAATLATRKQLVEALTNQGPSPTLTSFCQDVERRISTPVADHLAWWLQRVLHSEAHVAVSNWQDLLRRCQRNGEEGWGRLPFPGRLSAEASKRFAASVDRKEYKRLDAELDDRSLSDWDLHIYASQLFDFEDPLEGPSGKPDTSVYLTVDVYQQYLFWAWLLRQLTPEQQTKLRDTALEIVQTDKLSWIKDLVHPSALDIGL